jgi:hypothetical protein
LAVQLYTYTPFLFSPPAKQEGVEEVLGFFARNTSHIPTMGNRQGIGGEEKV